jgi:hypothetical protein
MSRIIRRPVEEPFDLDAVRDEVDRWYAVKRQSALITKQLDKGKEEIKKLVARYGTVQPESGSRVLDLGQPVGERKICKLKYQRSVTQGFNEQACREILEAKGLWDEMIEMVPQLDQSRINAAFFDRKITQEELDQMFPQRISHSLVLLDDNDKQVS